MAKPTGHRLACSPENIVDMLAFSPKPLSLQELQHSFGLKNPELPTILLPAIQKLIERDPAPIMQTGGKYKATPEAKASPLMVVRLGQRNSDGTYSLDPVNWAKGRSAQPFRLFARDVRNFDLDPGQKLLVRIKARRPKSADKPYYTCALLQKLEPDAPARITGTFQQSGGKRFFKPDNPAIHHSFVIASAQKSVFRDGDPVFARLREDFDQAHPAVDIEGLIWSPDQPATKLRTHILTKAGKRLSFPLDVEKTARRHAESVSTKGHTDRRDIHFVTIDGQEARDFDDAVYAEPDESPDNEGGSVIYIASSHSALFLPVGSPMDKMALQEPFSIYTNDEEAVHMQAKCVAENYASLKENEIRPAIVLRARISADGHVIESAFERQTIKVRHRMTYDRTDQAMAFNPPYTQHQQRLVQNLQAAYISLKARHERRQDLKFTDNKTYPSFDEEGHITGFRSEIDSPARDLIRKFMNLYNEQLGAVLYAADIPFVSRYQEAPDTDLVRSTRKKLAYLGIESPDHDHWTTEEMNEIIASAKSDPFLSENAEWYLLRTLKPAENALSKPGHYSLALETPVAWGTSSERRYSDVINQRALGRAQGWYAGPLVSGEESGGMSRAIDMMNYAEGEADKIQRNALYAQAIAHIKRHEGKTVPAFIVNVSENAGLILKIEDCPLSFNIPISAMHKGSYIRSSDRRSIYNEQKQIKYTAGEWIDVRVDHADPVNAVINLAIPGARNHETKVRAKPARADIKAKHSSPGISSGQGTRMIEQAEIIAASTRDGLTLRFTAGGKSQDVQWPISQMPKGSYQMRGQDLYLFPQKERPSKLFAIGESLHMQIFKTKSGKITINNYVNNYTPPTRAARKEISLRGLESLSAHPLLGQLEPPQDNLSL